MAVDPTFVQGVLKIMDIFLSIVAGVLCIRLFAVKEGEKHSLPWTFLAIGLLIFAFGEIMGSLDAFGFLGFSFKPFLPGIEVGVILFFIIALVAKLKEQSGVNL